MTALAPGYPLGGALADRHPRAAGVLTPLLVAGAYAAPGDGRGGFPGGLEA